MGQNIISYKNLEIWFVTGSQHLYGPDVLKEVVVHSKEIANFLNRSKKIPIRIKYKTLLTTPEEVSRLCKEANYSNKCIGVITWMHTFSPSKMWINGLKILHKPLLHLHTQYNDQIPWSKIDMNFMNLNQSAHGGREFGFINTVLKTKRKVVVGHWKSAATLEKVSTWSRVAAAWQDSQEMKIARFGDNMRQVGVTEGNKVAAQITFGYRVNGYGLDDLQKKIKKVSKRDINQTLSEYYDTYEVTKSLYKKGSKSESLAEAAKIEIGIRTFLDDGGYTAFTDTFENLTGLMQLPGIAVQRLMADGYGFGAEGDWKTAALVRTMKVMAHGLKGGNSFMEDYTYHFDPKSDLVLGAHMLEICPSISSERPICTIHPLGIGGKADPVRLVFTGTSGPSLNATIIDIGGRFRLLTNQVKTIQPEQSLPKLPVARVLWKPFPNLETAAHAWILAGGGHHTCYSQNITSEYLEDFAAIADIEFLDINEETELRSFKQNLKNNEVYFSKQ